MGAGPSTRPRTASTPRGSAAASPGSSTHRARIRTGDILLGRYLTVGAVLKLTPDYVRDRFPQHCVPVGGEVHSVLGQQSFYPGSHDHSEEIVGLDFQTAK